MNRALISATHNAFWKPDLKIVKVANLAPPHVNPTSGWDYTVMEHLQEAGGLFAWGQPGPRATEVIYTFRFSLLYLLFHACICVFISLPFANIQFLLLPLKTFLPFHLSLSFPSVFLSTPCISFPPSPCLSLCDMCFHYPAQGEVFRLTADHLLINSFHLAADSQSSLFIRTSLTKGLKQTHTIVYSFHLVGRLKPTWWFIYDSKHVPRWWLWGEDFFLTKAQANKPTCNLENRWTVHWCDVQYQLIWPMKNTKKWEAWFCSVISNGQTFRNSPPQ